MPPKDFYFGGGAAETIMHPLVAIILVIAVAMILLLPREKVVGPFLYCVFLIPLGQTLVLGGLHLFVFRIIVLTGCARLLFSKVSGTANLLGHGFDSIDKVFVAWAFFRTLAFLILFSFKGAALVNQGAFLLDYIGGYFFLRFLLQNDDDVQRAIKSMAIIAIVVAVCMLNERFHDQNVFGYLGGFPVTPQIRDGAIRAQGPFLHPILAGAFGGTSLALFVWLWKFGSSKALGLLSIAASTAIVLTSASSTPAMAYAAGIIGICFWPLRKEMRAFRWGIVFFLIGLQLVMKAPVWFLIARVDLTGASSGYHRAMLVDTFLRHFSDWWLIGTNANSTWGFDMWDLSNQFVAEGVSGGLVAFVAFIALICLSYRKLGIARKAVEGDKKQEWLLWILGTCLLSHIVAFFGISYFDQTRIAWLLILTAVSAATASKVPNERVEPVPLIPKFALRPATTSSSYSPRMTR